LHLNVLYGLSPCKTSTDWSRITEVESVYRAVRIGSLYKTIMFHHIIKQQKLESQTQLYYIILYYIIFYFILFYFILFYFILFYFILFYFNFRIHNLEFRLFSAYTNLNFGKYRLVYFKSYHSNALYLNCLYLCMFYFPW